MANSKVLVIFDGVPDIGETLYIREDSLGINLYQIFKASRTDNNQTKIPAFVPDDGIHGDRYLGFISTNYKTALEEDVNSSGLFTILNIPGESNSGIGQVLITANFTGAEFILDFNSSIASVSIENEGEAPPPEPIPNLVTPLSLSFIASVSDSEVAAKSFSIVTTGAWTITSTIPAWLNVSTLSGTSNALININPINYSALTAGTYTYTIIVTVGPDTFNVLVSLKVVKTIISPYETGKPAFTLDQKNFKLQGENTDTYFQFDSTINVFEFHTNVLKTYFIPQKALLFNGVSEINLGRLIHRLMKNFPVVNSDVNQYRLANLSINCKELTQADDTLIGESNLTNIKFVAGLSKGFTDYGFLEFNPKPTRVTSKGYYFLNILLSTGNFELRTFKNGQLIQTDPLPIDSVGPICKKVNFDAYDQGDKIDFVLDKVGFNTSTAPRKRFNIFPEQFFSNMIVWENEFLLQSAFEFTHDQTINTDFDRLSSKTIKDSVEKTTHYSISKDKKLTINTGWITMADIDSIESLLGSKRAFFESDNLKMDIVPIGKSLKNYDSKDELYDYTIEFTINRKYDEETYTP